MSETYYIGIYWKLRDGSIENWGRQLHHSLICLASVDSLFERWLLKGKDYTASQKEVSIKDSSFIEQLISENSDGKAIVGLWNFLPENPKVSVSLTLKLGFKHNSLVINLPPPLESEAANKLLSYSAMVQTLSCLIQFWNPDAALVTSRHYREILKEAYPDKIPYFGWMTLLNQESKEIPIALKDIEVVSITQNQQLLIAMRERLTVQNNEHLTLMSQIVTELSDSNLIQFHL